MKSKKKDFAEGILEMMKAQFGDAAKVCWVYDGDLCPCCMKRQADLMKYDGKDALSINAFMYRERGVLIAYILCGQCAMDIIELSKNGPTPMHKSIETNLINAYLRQLN
jgi:hypothetical protein